MWQTCRSCRPSVSEEVYPLSVLLEVINSIRFVSWPERGLAHTTVLHILKERLGMSKIA
jgi:hypothetical protein